MEEHLHKSIITLPEASYHSATQETLVLEQCTGHQIHHLKCTPVVAENKEKKVGTNSWIGEGNHQ